MTIEADAMLDMIAPGVELVYGSVTGVNSVKIGSAATAVTLPAVRTVVDGDTAAMLRGRTGDMVILGALDVAGPIGIMLERSTAFSVSNGGGGDTITWGTGETYLHHRPSDFKTGSADIITIPTGLGGVYSVHFSGRFATNSTGVRQISVAVGSNSTSGDELSLIVKQPASATLNDSMSVSGAILLDDGATLTANAYQNSGGALNLTNMRFQAIRLH